MQAAHCPLVVIITGGIASGKSTVCAHFSTLGVPIIDTDLIAREIVKPGQSVLKEIVAYFGDQILLIDGNLDRPKLRSQIFASAEDRQKLESITHPVIWEQVEHRLGEILASYCIVAVPLYTETATPLRNHRLLVVDCEPAVQLVRIMSRDGSTKAQAKKIIAAQATRSKRLALADDIIHNDGEIDSLGGQVATLHETYLELALKRSPA